ncbi:MAG: hypothetical protein ACR2N2_07210 [Acidimicrobiia bacterium]
MSSNLLRNALRLNAGFSAASAAVLIVGGASLATWLGVPTEIVYIVGFGLLPFAALAWWTSRTLDRRSTMAIIVGDVVWVVLAFAVIFGVEDAMSAAGAWALALVSIVVADFAIAQTIGLRRLETTS